MVRMRGKPGTFDALRDLVPGAIRALRLWRDMARTPAFELDAMPENVRGKVTGVVRPFGAVLEAPLSGRLCVYYAVTIAARHAQAVSEIASELDAVTFAIENGGRRAIVDPANATVSARVDCVSTSKAAFDAEPRQRALLERHALLDRDWFWTDSMRYTEAVIAIDRGITVLGSAIREPDPERAPDALYRGDAATRLRFHGSERFPIVIRDVA